MRKIDFLTLSLWLALAFASCSKESVAVKEQLSSGKITEKFFDATSDAQKTTLSGAAVNWAAGDVITVFDVGGTSDTYTVTAEDVAKDPSKVSFTVNVGDAPYYAAVSGNEVSFDASEEALTVSRDADGTFGGGDALVASSQTKALHFHHAYGWLHFTCTKSNIQSIHLAMDRKCLGKTKVTFETIGGKPSTELTGSYDWSLATTSNDIYIPVVQGTYYKFSIVVKTADGSFYVENQTQVGIVAGGVREMGDITSRLTPMYFYESFDNYKNAKGGNDGNFSVATGSAPADNDNSGWVMTQGRQGLMCTNFGTQSALGAAVTPALGVKPVETAVLLKFRAALFESATENGTQLQLSISGGGALSMSQVTLEMDAWNDYCVGITGATAATRITFAGQQAANSRFYLDEVMIVPPTTVETSSTLTSGQALLSSLNSGLSPLSFALTSKVKVIGAVPNGSDYDLFFNGVEGALKQWWGKSDAGCCVCSYVGEDADGNPIYTNPIAVSAPFGLGTRFVKVTKIGGQTTAFYVDGTKLKVATYNSSSKTFTSTGTEFDISTVTLPLQGIDVLETADGVAYAAFVTYDKSDAQVFPSLDKDDCRYYADGLYRGTVPSANIYKMKINTTKWSAGTIVSVATSVMLAPTGIATYKNSFCDGYVLCNQFGALKFVKKDGSKAEYLTTGGPSDTVTEPISNPSAATNIVVAGNHFVVSGEGATQLIKTKSAAWSEGANGPQMATTGPQPIRTRTAPLYAGSICVPNIVDMNGDGVLDIVAGSSEGRIFYFQNFGSDRNPVFGIPEAIQENGHELVIRPGYYTVNGPMEAARGYVCPTVYDWNQDGLQDIIFTSAEGKVEVMLNIGTATSPAFGRRNVLMKDGIELYGLWRMRPAAANIGGVSTLILPNGRGELYVYQKVGHFTVREILSAYEQNFPNSARPSVNIDGSGTYPVTLHRSSYASQSEWGRSSVQLVDWDGDGIKDIIISTPAEGCVPSKEKGLPYSRGAEGLQVVWLKNKGGNSDFTKMDYPRQFIFKGMDFYLGSMPCYAYAANMGAVLEGLPNLFVGAPDGRVYYFQHKDLQEVTLW